MFRNLRASHHPSTTVIVDKFTSGLRKLQEFGVGLTDDQAMLQFLTTIEGTPTTRRIVARIYSTTNTSRSARCTRKW
jgi:hypothetical protein